jgi:DNA-binding response OmpR family regulator
MSPRPKRSWFRQKLDLIVTDLALPGEDGAAFLTWLRAPGRDKARAVPVIAVTGFYETYPLAEVRGWAAYVQKPVGIEEFVRTCAAVLNIDGRSERNSVNAEQFSLLKCPARVERAVDLPAAQDVSFAPAECR